MGVVCCVMLCCVVLFCLDSTAIRRVVLAVQVRVRFDFGATALSYNTYLSDVHESTEGAERGGIGFLLVYSKCLGFVVVLRIVLQRVKEGTGQRLERCSLKTTRTQTRTIFYIIPDVELTATSNRDNQRCLF